jgi:hypothetical protein
MRQFLVLALCWAVGLAPFAQSRSPIGAGLKDEAANLPVVLLEAKQPIRAEAKVPCTIRLLLPGERGPANSALGVARFHGASSQGYPKKSYALTLEAPVSWLGMRSSGHWLLNAAFIDRSLMRHKLSYDLFRALSRTHALRFAAASRFVDVVVGSEYRGVYLLMERIDRSSLGFQSYVTNATEHACIYKAVDHAATFDHLGHDGYQQREPDPLLRGAYWSPLDRFNRFASATSDPVFFDPAKGISSRLDLDNTIDFHLLILLTCNMDGFDKNLLIARDAPRPNAPAPRFFFVPWDYDATFGRNWEGSPVGPHAWLSNPLFDRLLSDPAYRRRFAARWKQLREGPFSVSNLDRMIDENVSTLGAAVERNAACWSVAGEFYPDTLTFGEDIGQMKRWIAERTKWLDKEIARRAGP